MWHPIHQLQKATRDVRLVTRPHQSLDFLWGPMARSIVYRRIWGPRCCSWRTCSHQRSWPPRAASAGPPDPTRHACELARAVAPLAHLHIRPLRRSAFASDRTCVSVCVWVSECSQRVCFLLACLLCLASVHGGAIHGPPQGGIASQCRHVTPPLHMHMPFMLTGAVFRDTCMHLCKEGSRPPTAGFVVFVEGWPVRRSPILGETFQSWHALRSDRPKHNEQRLRLVEVG